ncbi:MAG: amidohydrolase [Gammaproteobacteria bacterium]|nr:amidohydrolase [Gammaproteobacteria bacterium]
MTKRTDPEGTRLPIKLDTTSNGEFAPIPLSPTNKQAVSLAHRWVSDNARRVGLGRRDFLVSACGAATTLLAFNTANAASGKTGGHFELASDSALDPAAAAERLDGREFIFDVQGHFVNPDGRWLDGLPESARPLSFAPKTKCALADLPGDRAYLDCLGRDEFLRDVFLDSDTDMMVLSFVPSRREAEPLTIEEADATRRIVDTMEGTHRLMIHGRVNPNQDGDLDAMDELAERWNVAAWKTYTQWGPDGNGFFLHDEKIGIPFIEKARALGVKVIAIHKGIPFGKRSYEHSLCDDIGIVAKQFPDVDFLIYHSGFVPGQPEQAYAPDEKRDGIDSLVRSLLDNEILPNSNVYAELGSTWRFLMREPDSAAHALGKLFKYVGENNVLWGTDSIWYGSPQDQIQAFRAFQIAEPLRERFGYPAMTPALRAKVFGLNAMKPYGIDAAEMRRRAGADAIGRQRAVYLEEPDPHFLTYGPKTRRQFLNLLRWNGDELA